MPREPTCGHLAVPYTQGMGKGSGPNCRQAVELGGAPQVGVPEEESRIQSVPVIDGPQLTSKQMQAHVQQLRKERKIKLLTKDNLHPFYKAMTVHGSAFAIPWNGAVYFPTINNEMRYMIALHELGHVQMYRKRGKRMAPCLADEAEAWQWALEYAAIDQAEARQIASTFLRGYFHHQRMIFSDKRFKRQVPFEHHVFWKIINHTTTPHPSVVKMLGKINGFGQLTYFKPIDRAHLLKTHGKYVAPKYSARAG